MAEIYLVRHGKAAAGFGSHRDPGLDAVGRDQAEQAADNLETLLENRLAGDMHPKESVKLWSSPLARAQETAQPLAARWGASVSIETRVAEIPSPTEDLNERAAWLGQAMQCNWSALDATVQAWRQDLVDCLLGLEQDSILFSHFVAINAAVGAAQNDDRMRVFAPDNASITILSNADGDLVVKELGMTAVTKVN